MRNPQQVTSGVEKRFVTFPKNLESSKTQTIFQGFIVLTFSSDPAINSFPPFLKNS